MKVYKMALTVLMLALFSMGAVAQVKVVFGEKGEDTFSGTGGTITVSQEKKDNQVTVTLTVTPDKGYTITKDDIKVYATYPPSGTRSPEIADNLTLYFNGSEKEDVKDPSAKRDYTLTVDANLNVWVREATFASGSKGGDRSTGPVEITTDNNENGTLEDNEKKLYLIQTNAFQSFYIAPQANNTITTNNILGDYMLWYFLDAGVVGDTQYYYIVNNSTGKYVYNHNGNSRGINVTDFASLSDVNKEKCKFKFVLDNSNNTTDFYNIDVKASQQYYGLNKQGGSESNTNPIRLTDDNYIHDINSKWKFIRYNGTYSWPAPPFTPSTDSDKHFYKINNVQNDTYYVSTDATPDKVTYASTETDRMVWYLKEAPSDPSEPWFKYYYIINPSIGNRYMYYSGTATNGSNQANAVSVKEYDSANEDRYQFVVIQAAKGDFANNKDSRVECYAIIPKLLKETLWGSNSIGLTNISDGANMGIISSRGATNNAQWKFVPTTFSFECEPPTITYVEATNTITMSHDDGATIYYTTDGSDPTVPASGSTQTYSAGSTGFQPESNVSVIKAVASKLADGSDISKQTIQYIYKVISSSSDIVSMNGAYRLAEGFTTSASIGTESNPFKGTIDGQMNIISGLSYPLVAYADGATIKNVILDNVNISSGTHVGAICGEATGDTRIYNCGVLATGSTVVTDEDGYTKITSCSSEISGSGYVGGIVGLLDGSSRVINCFSYANVNGGSYAGGIVGYNNVATTATYLKTMVMNCMFYGEVSGSSIAPIYNGRTITNVGENKGVGNYNYFRMESTYIQDNTMSKVYNCALGAETRYLQRFEFFRHLLNSHRELAAWWATGNAANKDEIKKWVLEPSQIGSTMPYPILKVPAKYPSVVNIDAEHAITTTERNKGGKLGTLTVTIQSGSGAQFGEPAGASITTSSLTLNITDKDFEHFNFNYGKVQLPYYNDIGSKNYTGNRVVTGWKIVSITGGTPGEFSTSTADAPSFNYADRHSTNKDLFSVSGRVFNQGAYWDVPEGVTAITIQPYWAKAAYLADSYADVVYNIDMNTAYGVPDVGGGQVYTNGNRYSIGGENQTVYTTSDDARDALGLNSGHTVYDYAIVLVGNFHKHDGITSSNKAHPYTIMSIDADHDNEPDYSYILRFDNRSSSHPVRVDFLNIPGLGMAQKSSGGKGSYNLGILQPLGWFESTNTSLFRVTQFEYDNTNRVAAPYIVQGGVMEQWVSGQNNGASNKTTYFHVGGNVWFKEFHRGTHQDKQLQSKHPPISVTGGDYDEFYLTGLYRGDVANYEDNAECYINGGRFGVVAGAAMEGIGKAGGANNTGNITWQVQNADINEFYGGGLNAAKPVQGNINTTIEGGYIKLFCGGPKFGDMNEGKTVTTTATGCIFDTFFGAGYGGNSYSRYAPTNINFIDGDYGSTNWNTFVNDSYKQDYNATYKGVSTFYTSQYLPMSNNTQNVARVLVDFVSFSLATTRNVTSTLTGCTINQNFYGGGSLGMVAGPVTSTLTNCQVVGNVFGAGYSASLPKVQVMNTGGFVKAPFYDENLGAYMAPEYPGTVEYTWEHRNTVSSTATAIDKANHILYTTEDLDALGTVTGIATLNIEDGTTVMGSVYGGGESSDATNHVVVNINGGTINGNVHGGGYGITTEVGGNVEVNIGSRTGTSPEFVYSGSADIGGDVYGGSAFGSVNTNTSNTTNVNLFGGTIHGDAYGGGLGQIGQEAQAAVGEVGDDGYQPAVPAIEDVKAQVKGIVNVTLDGVKFEIKTAPDDKGNQIPVSGRIFGCNNLNGSPEGDVNITIKRTVAGNHQRTSQGELTNLDDAQHTYELAAVYGGGNLAAYLPNGPAATAVDNDYKNTMAKATITIDGCDNVSIQQVYGGGNAASTPAALVYVNGSWEIEELFGGGNGMDRIQKNGKWYANPGANMGFLEYADDAENAQTPELRATNYGYGTGETNVNIYGGRIHRVFGGANTKGNVRKIALTILEDENLCTFQVDEAYGGGKSASMDGTAELRMACIPGLKAAYGGAQEADIHNDVTLNITNGTFDRVFGGNNKSGTISGTITVNIEETGCKPVIIGQVYGGGNLAPYTAPSDKPGPTVNVRSFTSIGEVFGGGFGTSAVVTGDTYVNVNEVILSNTDTGQTTDYSKQSFTVTDEISNVVTSAPLYDRPADATNGSIGVIGNIYGGGNEAKVDGDTHVSIGNLQEVEINTLEKVDGNYQKKPVKGADIRGNVYGGGNKAEVTGSTNVKIGKK